MTGDKQIYVVVILLCVLTLLLSACFGAVAGGLVGYLAGRRAVSAWISLHPSTPVPIEPELPQPTLPETLPKVPIAGGALITKVVKDSPADQAGIRVGDIIIAVDGKQVEGENTLAKIIRAHRPGDTIEITLWRVGRERSLRVKLGKHPEEPDTPYLGVYYISFMRMESPGRND